MTTTNCIKYSSGYKYHLEEDFEIQTVFRPDKKIVTDYATLDIDGILHIFRSYAWDGPSGPTIDRSSNMRGSLPHDVLYQMIRENYLPLSCREEADNLLKKCWIEDGMYEWLATVEVAAVKRWGIGSARPSAEHLPQFAP
jgi:hypothetical protein